MPATSHSVDFSRAQHWLFDLDNTLYPSTCNLQTQMADKARELIADVTGIPLSKAHAEQRRYLVEYGTAQRGLAVEHGISAETFYASIHDVDYSVIDPNPSLQAALARISAKKYIFTNGRADHAERVLARLGCRNEFSDLFDISFLKYTPKPSSDAYHTVLEKIGADGANVLFVDDVISNLRPAADLGMTTVWLRSDSEFSHGELGDHVHVVADDLVPWLNSV